MFFQDYKNSRIGKYKPKLVTNKKVTNDELAKIENGVSVIMIDYIGSKGT